MKRDFIRDSIQLLILMVVNNFPNDECWNCVCFQEFISFIERKAGKDISIITSTLKVPEYQIHRRLGCDPCPTAEAYLDYELENKKIG